ncbi:MAG: DUF3822 family protein [Chitinophagaceae bacterium]
METGSKKHIIAERFLDAGISVQLCNLFVADIADFKVLSLYSTLSRKLVAYKVITLADTAHEEWLNDSSVFNEVFYLNTDPDFELLPASFSEQVSKYNSEFVVKTQNPGIHLIYGIHQWMQDHKGYTIFALGHSDLLSVLIFHNDKCCFANTFKYADQTEFLYFVINAMQLVGVKQEEAHLKLDYQCFHKYGLPEFLSSYFLSVEPMQLPFEDPDPEIDNLPELLMPNHLLSLCV